MDKTTTIIILAILLVIAVNYIGYNIIYQTAYNQGRFDEKSNSLVQIAKEQALSNQVIWWNGQNITIVPTSAFCRGQNESAKKM